MLFHASRHVILDPVRIPYEKGMLLRMQEEMHIPTTSFPCTLAALALVCLAGCGRGHESVTGEPNGSSPEISRPADFGAYDVVKMNRYGQKMGPVYFAHALHADLTGLEGRELACSYCHPHVCGPPRRCGECHVPRVKGKPRPKLPTT